MYGTIWGPYKGANTCVYWSALKNVPMENVWKMSAQTLLSSHAPSLSRQRCLCMCLASWPKAALNKIDELRLTTVILLSDNTCLAIVRLLCNTQFYTNIRVQVLQCYNFKISTPALLPILGLERRQMYCQMVRGVSWWVVWHPLHSSFVSSV